MATLKVVKPTAPPLIETLVDDYLNHCRAEGKSVKTVQDAYGYPLRRILLPFLAAEGVTEPTALNERLLDRLINKLTSDGGERGQLAKASVNSYARAINGFLSWLRTQEEGKGLTVKASVPKLGKRQLDILSREEIQAMEDVARTERDKLIVRVLADTGIRLGELLGLKVDDLMQPTTRSYFLRVQGKGDKGRDVPVAPALFIRLNKYAQRGRPRDAGTDRLFLSSRRRRGVYLPLTSSGVAQLIDLLGKEAELKHDRVYPHLLRHSYATWMIKRGINPLQLAKILGHNSLEMINQVYAHLTPDDTYEAMMAALQEA
jgi:site-specific recombinase XerD